MSRLSILLIRLSIYVSPLFVFSFFAAGKGILQPSLFLIIGASLCAAISSRKRFSLKQSLGNTSAIQLILIFLVLAFLSTAFSFLAPGIHVVSLYRSVGVLISLGVLLWVYLMVSSLNATPQHANLFFKDFLIVATIVSVLIILEFLLVKLLGTNVLYLAVKGIHEQLPYPSMPWRTTDIHNRFKGILNEPGDVGNYVLPAFMAMAYKLSATENERTRICIIALLVLYGASILLSASIVAVALMLFLIALLVFYRRVFYSPGLFISISSGVLFILYLLLNAALDLAIRYQNSLHPAISSRLGDLIGFLNTQQYDNYSNLSVQVMLNSYNAMLIALQKNPLFGTGLGNFSLSYEVAASANFIETRLNANDGYSMFLRLLAEVGILGLVAFLSIFVSRLAQGKSFISRLKANATALAIGAGQRPLPSEFYDGFEQPLTMINAAACACLLNALLNYPTYWNIMLPMLFALCYKASYQQRPILMSTFASTRNNVSSLVPQEPSNEDGESHEDDVRKEENARNEENARIIDDSAHSEDNISNSDAAFLAMLERPPEPPFKG